jgi:UDP-glucose 4-epimerase
VKALIFGGAGFIGSHLVDKLIGNGLQVTIFERHGASLENISHLAGKVHILYGDMLDSSEILDPILDADYIYHLAGSSNPSSKFLSPADHANQDVMGAISLLEQCIKSDIKKLVFISSGGTIYGVPHYLPIDEMHTQNPITPYGISKLMIEKFLLLYKYHHGLNCSILRVANPYGSRQRPGTGQGVIASWIESIKSNRSIDIWGDGSIVRDYIHISDVVSAIYDVSLSTSKETIFNIGSGHGLSLLDLHERFESILGFSVSKRFSLGRNVDVPANVLKINLVMSQIGWTPKVDISEGLAQTFISAGLI